MARKEFNPELSVRSRNIVDRLVRLGLTSWEDIASYGAARFLADGEIGQSAVEEMREALAQRGLRFSDEGGDDLKSKRIKDLESALMVYDVTLYCLVVSGNVDELFQGQVRAAAEAHQHVMGEPSMLVENRAGKNYLEKCDASGR